MAERKSAASGIWASVIFLIAGMSLGFAFLSFAWDGSIWIKVLFGALYLFTVFMVIRSTSRVVKAIRSEEEKKNGRIQKP
ncbi:MAG: hypothetical protein ACI4NM_07235 [Bullifex sp.]